ncbi:MAG: 2-oxoacid:acceptor oxidoreductase family protein [Clostridia bacterium]|nr:2-oxoacid:acceptor oxidoreductase family protein [Clostridia bacterium]
MEYQIRLAGSGGQGLILAAIILAEAAIQAGYNVVQTQSYGPEARGGASRADVIISKGEIDYPKVTNPNLLLVMSQQAYDKFSCLACLDGTIVVDSTFVDNICAAHCQVVSVPITKAVLDHLGENQMANVAALGVLAARQTILKPEFVREAIRYRVPSHKLDINLAAFDLGIGLDK